MIKNYKQLKKFIAWEKLPDNEIDKERFKEEVVKYVNIFENWIKNNFLEDGEVVEALSIDYVEPGTFEDETRAYHRIQWAYGGPTFEARIFDDNTWELVYLDWFSGVGIELNDDEINILRDVYLID